MTTINFAFYDEVWNEDFIVNVPDTKNAKEEAMKIAKQYFCRPRCLGRVSDYYAETCGLDTY